MEAWLRVGIFLGMFSSMALCELWAPRRRLQQRRSQRWLANWSLALLDTVLLRLTVGALAVQTALWAQQRQWGVFAFLSLPVWANIVLSILVLDFAIYLQHVCSHRVPLLWRLHAVHHTDLDLDVTTGLRFHPVEILLSMLYKALWVFCLGAHPTAVLAFEVILNATAQFTHSNLALPVSVDRWLRFVLVTPDVHRIHHSVVPVETNANFGFAVPWWDRLCRTYRAQPLQAHTTMPLGLAPYREATPLSLGKLFILPWQWRQPVVDVQTP